MDVGFEGGLDMLMLNGIPLEGSENNIENLNTGFTRVGN